MKYLNIVSAAQLAGDDTGSRRLDQDPSDKL